MITVTTQHKQMAAIYSAELSRQEIAYEKGNEDNLKYHTAKLEALKEVINSLWGITSTQLLKAVYPE